MEVDSNKLTDIKNIVKILEEKRGLKESIFFQALLPSIDGISGSDFSLSFGASNYSTKDTFYFLTFAVLHEFLQLFNDRDSTNKEIRNFLFENIIERDEKPLDVVMKDLKLKTDKTFLFDFSNKGFFMTDKKINFRKGSELKNYSYCYNNNNITSEILKIFLITENVIDASQDFNFLIKFPTVISTVLNDALKLLSYIFSSVTVFKQTEDSFIKDSFHVICNGIDVKKYKFIRKHISKCLHDKNLGIEDLSKNNIERILSTNIHDRYQDFNKILAGFITNIELIIFSFLTKLTDSYKLDLKSANRTNSNWEELDYYKNYFRIK